MKKSNLRKPKGTLKVSITMILTVAICLGIFTGCGAKSMDEGQSRKTLIIADQFGLAYAPIEIMKQKGYLEKALTECGLEDVEIKWQKFGNTVAIREAMLSGSLDIGFIGIPPFLLALDNGMPWRIMTGLSESKVSLITKDENIKTLNELSEDNRIILPQPGSIQHILLMMASEKTFGDAHKFDEQLIALSHPDGVVAFTSGNANQLHFTTPPFIQSELKVEGAHEILSGQDAFGDDFTFIVGVCQASLYNDSKTYQSFLSALEQSFAFMEQSPEETYLILSESYDYSIEQIKEYLSPDQMHFGSEVKGVERFVKFMRETNQLKSDYDNDTLFWSNK